MKDKMTWFVFCKGLRFLRFTKFRVIIIASNESNESYYVDETVNIAQMEDDGSYEADFQIPTNTINNENVNSWLEDLIESNKKKD